MTAPMPLPLAVELKLRGNGLDVQAQFRVPPGHVCGLVGPAGSGKLSLMRCTAGLLQAQSGRISLGHEVLYDHPTGVNRPPEQRRLAWLDGRGRLFPHLDVQRNLTYGHRRLPPRLRHVSAASIIDWLDLSSLLTRWPHELSAGQRQKVALGRALLAAPNGLLLYDPLAEVPAHEQPELLDRLGELRAHFRLPVVFASPRIDEVIRLADDVVILHEGRVASAGPLTRVLSDVSLSTFLEGVHAGSVLEGRIRQHDIEWLLTDVEVAGQQVMVPALLHAEGRKVRLKVRARDVNIHREPLADTSVSNQLRGRIVQVMRAAHNGSYGAVAVELHRLLDAQSPEQGGAEVMLWSLLTRRSIEQMGLAPGQDCYVSFKAMAVSVTPRS